MFTSLDFHVVKHAAYRRCSTNYFPFVLPIESPSMAAFPTRSPHRNHKSKEYDLSAYFLNSSQGWKIASTVLEEKKTLALHTVDVLGQ